MLYETKFLVSLGVTSLIEVPSVFLLARYLFRKKFVWWRGLVIAFLASFMTLPYLWFILPNYVNNRYYLWYGEGIVFVFEAVFYLIFLKVRWWQAAILSLAANLLSYFIGIKLVEYLI